MNKKIENLTLNLQKIMPNKSVRYYKAEITRDLFDLIVFCRWGTIGTKRGNVKSHVVESFEQANLVIDEIKKRRTSRGYILQN